MTVIIRLKSQYSGVNVRVTTGSSPLGAVLSAAGADCVSSLMECWDHQRNPTGWLDQSGHHSPLGGYSARPAELPPVYRVRG